MSWIVFLFLPFFFFKVERITRVSLFQIVKISKTILLFIILEKKWHLQKNEIQKEEKSTSKKKEKMIKILKNLHVDVSRCFDKVIVTSETGTESKLRKLARSEKRSTILQEEEALTNRFNLPRDHLLFAVYRTWCYFLVTRQTCNRNFSWIAVLAKAKAHPLGNWD